jgi:hypothetical protein
MFRSGVRPLPCSFPSRSLPNLQPHFRKRSFKIASSTNLEGNSTDDSMDISAAAEKFGWQLDATKKDFSADRQVVELPLAAIRRPLQGSRTNSKYYLV